MEQPSRRYRFGKQEKLCSEKQIAELFEKGKWEKAGILRLRYLLKPSDKFSMPVILISVPKKQIRRAVGRNRIKRQIREAYRLNKYLLTDRPMSSPQDIYLAIIFTGKTGVSYWEIEADLKKLLEIMCKKVVVGDG